MRKRSSMVMSNDEGRDRLNSITAL